MSSTFKLKFLSKMNDEPSPTEWYLACSLGTQQTCIELLEWIKGFCCWRQLSRPRYDNGEGRERRQAFSVVWEKKKTKSTNFSIPLGKLPCSQRVDSQSRQWIIQISSSTSSLHWGVWRFLHWIILFFQMIYTSIEKVENDRQMDKKSSLILLLPPR